MNKNTFIAAGAVLGLAAFATPALASVDVSINVGQPGFYGQIDLGDAPPPRVIYREPRIVEHVTVEQEPIYLHVRPGESRSWSRYCGEYHACGRKTSICCTNSGWISAAIRGLGGHCITTMCSRSRWRN